MEAAVEGVALAEAVALQAEREIEETVNRTEQKLSEAQEALRVAILARDAALTAAPLVSFLRFRVVGSGGETMRQHMYSSKTMFG